MSPSVPSPGADSEGFRVAGRSDHRSLDIRGLHYEVTEHGAAWWQKLLAMELPCEWNKHDSADAEQEVRPKNNKKQILKDVTFGVRSGQMLAILGSSGR